MRVPLHIFRENGVGDVHFGLRCWLTSLTDLIILLVTIVVLGNFLVILYVEFSVLVKHVFPLEKELIELGLGLDRLRVLHKQERDAAHQQRQEPEKARCPGDGKSLVH